MILITAELKNGAIIDVEIKKGNLEDKDLSRDVDKARAAAFEILDRGFSVMREQFIDVYPKEMIQKIRLTSKPHDYRMRAYEPPGTEAEES